MPGLGTILLLLVISLLFAAKSVRAVRVGSFSNAFSTLEVETHLGELDASRYREYQVTEDCAENARRTFEHLDLPDLTEAEKQAFATRFAAKMVEEWQAGKPTDQWINDVKKYLEDEKPAVTAARAAITNEQQDELEDTHPDIRGFKIKVRPWMEQESMAAFKERLMKSDAMADEPVVESQPEEPKAATLPLAFEAVERWPKCGRVFSRVSHQAHCGSCWAFAALATVENRVCIASGGKHTQKLSRAVGSNCVAEWVGGRDACRGGSATWVWSYLEKNKGIPSEECIPYYGTSGRIDYFTRGGKAPKCRSQCQVDFNDIFAQDSHFVSGMHTGSWNMNLGSKNYLERARQELFERGPYVMTVAVDAEFVGYSSGVYYKNELCLTANGCSADGKTCINHAVTVLGYTPVSWIGVNSWGDDWGNSGRFEIGTCMGGHWIIPGPITSQKKCPSREDCGGRTCEEWVDMGHTCDEIKKTRCDCSQCFWQNGAGNFESLC